MIVVLQQLDAAMKRLPYGFCEVWVTNGSMAMNVGLLLDLSHTFCKSLRGT